MASNISTSKDISPSSHRPSDDTCERQHVEQTLTMQRMLVENTHTDTVMDLSLLGADMTISYLCAHAPLVENFIYGSSESHDEVFLTGRVPSKARLLPMALSHFTPSKNKTRTKSYSGSTSKDKRQVIKSSESDVSTAPSPKGRKRAATITDVSTKSVKNSDDAPSASSSSTSSPRDSISGGEYHHDERNVDDAHHKKRKTSRRNSNGSNSRSSSRSSSRKSNGTTEKKAKVSTKDVDANAALPYHQRRGKPKSTSSLSVYAFGQVPVKQFPAEFPRVAFAVSDEAAHRHRCQVLATALVDMKRLQYMKNGRSEPFRPDALVQQLATELAAWSDFKMEAFSAVYAAPSGVSAQRLFGDEYPKWLRYVTRILDECVVDTRSLQSEADAIVYSAFVDNDGVAVIRCDFAPDELWLIHVGKLCINTQNNWLNMARVATKMAATEYPDVDAAYRQFFNAAHVAQTAQIILQELRNTLGTAAKQMPIDTDALQTTLISLWNRAKYDTLVNTLRVSLCIDDVLKSVREFAQTKLESKSPRAHKMLRSLVDGFGSGIHSIPLDPDWMVAMVGQLSDVQRMVDTSNNMGLWGRAHNLAVTSALRAHAQVSPTQS